MPTIILVTDITHGHKEDISWSAENEFAATTLRSFLHGLGHTTRVVTEAEWNALPIHPNETE